MAGYDASWERWRAVGRQGGRVRCRLWRGIRQCRRGRDRLGAAGGGRA